MQNSGEAQRILGRADENKRPNQLSRRELGVVSKTSFRISLGRCCNGFPSKDSLDNGALILAWIRILSENLIVECRSSYCRGGADGTEIIPKSMGKLVRDRLVAGRDVIKSAEEQAPQKVYMALRFPLHNVGERFEPGLIGIFLQNAIHEQLLFDLAEPEILESKLEEQRCETGSIGEQ